MRTAHNPKRPLRHRTGHDIHFLDRLERVTVAEMERALVLYRERDVVEALAREALGGRPPSEEERIALALADGQEPPHAIVAADGHFVTCLGPGMSVAGHPRVPFERVRVHLHRHWLHESQLRTAEAVKEERGIYEVVKRLRRAGGRLDREAFRAAEAMVPLLDNYPLVAAIDALADTMSDVPELGRRARPEALRRWWCRAWESMHYFLLAATRGQATFELLDGARAEGLDGIESLLLSVVEWGHAPLGLRALWVIGRAGKAALPAMRRALGSATTQEEWLAAARALMALAARNRQLQAEVMRCFSTERVPPHWRGKPRAQAMVDWARQHLACIDCLQETVAGSEPELRDTTWKAAVGRSIVMLRAVAATKGVPNALQAMGLAVEDAIARCDAGEPGPLLAMAKRLPQWLASRQWLLVEPEQVDLTTYAMAVLMRAPAEAFYWPEAETGESDALFDEAHAAEMAAYWDTRPETVKNDGKVGRNEPCPCGSGKKLKRCCASVQARTSAAVERDGEESEAA